MIKAEKDWNVWAMEEGKGGGGKKYDKTESDKGTTTKIPAVDVQLTPRGRSDLDEDADVLQMSTKPVSFPTLTCWADCHRRGRTYVGANRKRPILASDIWAKEHRDGTVANHKFHTEVELSDDCVDPEEVIYLI